MDDRSYRFLVRVAVVMGLAWVGWTVYDGFFAHTEPYAQQFNAADRFFQDGHYEEALAEYQAVLINDRDNLRALGGKAQALMQLGRNAEALDLLNQLIARKPEFAPAYVSRGILRAVFLRLLTAAASDQGFFRLYSSPALRTLISAIGAPLKS